MCSASGFIVVARACLQKSQLWKSQRQVGLSWP